MKHKQTLTIYIVINLLVDIALDFEFHLKTNIFTIFHGCIFLQQASEQEN